VRTLRGSRAELFFPLEAVPGKVAQVDFGVAHDLIAGCMQKFILFLTRAPGKLGLPVNHMRPISSFVFGRRSSLGGSTVCPAT